MNVFASELKLPLDSLEAAWEVILENRFHYVDLACATHLETQQQRFFVQLAGIGLDAEVLEETSSEFKMAFGGPVSYFFSFLKVLLRKQPMLLLRCEENGEKKGTSILLGNGKFYGGAFPFFPDAMLDDGHLHVLLFKHHHFWELLGNFPALLLGQPKSLRTVQYFKTKELAITPQDSRFQIPFELDGEMVSHLPIRFSIEQKRLPVLV
jgi:diacylglycerol kinase (ATP)